MPTRQELEDYGEAVKRVVSELGRWLDDSEIPPPVAGAALMRMCAIVMIMSTNATDEALMNVWQICLASTRYSTGNLPPDLAAKWQEWKGRLM